MLRGVDWPGLHQNVKATHEMRREVKRACDTGDQFIDGCVTPDLVKARPWVHTLRERLSQRGR